jgi:amidophosphoribosyltransferase
MCGILAVIANHKITSFEFINLLQNIQHRGQDSSGIAYVKNNTIETLHKPGLVKKLHNIDNIVNSDIYLGHTRYTTSGQRNNLNSTHGIHPIVSTFKGETYAFIFNGNIPFISEQFKMDTEFINNFIQIRQHLNFNTVLLEFIRQVPRAFNIVFLYQQKLYAIRDCYGTRPFKLLKTKDDSRIYISSEDYFLEEESWMNFDIPEGSLTIIDKDLDIVTIPTIETKPLKETAHCVFEHIYFMNEKSMNDGFLVKDSRVKMGYLLANTTGDILKFQGDEYIVTSIPDTATTSAIVYAKTLELTYTQIIKKNKNVNRTFIITDAGERNNYSREKYIIDGDKVKDKNIILVDDSIVRGTTLKTLVSILKKYSPKSIHIRITSPPITNTCNLGIDIPTREELIYNSYNSEDNLKDYLKVNSLKYLDIESLKSIFTSKGICMGCINGDYNKNSDLEW